MIAYTQLHCIIESQCYKIIEQFELEGAFKDHLVQRCCHGQGLDKVAQKLFQTDLPCFQQWDVYHLSGQLLIFHHPFKKKYFFMSSLNLSMFYFKIITNFSTVPDKKIISLKAPSRYWKTALQSSQTLLQAELPNIQHKFSQDFLWTHSKRSMFLANKSICRFCKTSSISLSSVHDI